MNSNSIPQTIRRTIIHRPAMANGSWEVYPLGIDILANCPICGLPRAEAYDFRFHEDGEWFNVQRWDNPCGHIDRYTEVYLEAQRLLASQNKAANL